MTKVTDADVGQRGHHAPVPPSRPSAAQAQARRVLSRGKLSQLGTPGTAPGSDLAPTYEIHVGSERLGPNVTALVNSVSTETSDHMMNMCEIKIDDPNFVISESKLFQPGNEIAIAFGYGTALTHDGLYILTRPQYSYPDNGSPSVTVKGYTADWRMSGNGPDPAPKGTRGKTRRSFSRSHAGVTYSDVVADIAEDYGFELDIDETPHPDTNLIQKAGMDDYSFVRGMANLTGFLFWVDGDVNRRWTMHFRDPERMYDSSTGRAVQEEKTTFRYGGLNASLLSFHPEFSISAARTKIRAEYKDPITGERRVEEIEEAQTAPEMNFEGDVADKVHQNIQSAGAVRLFFNDFSVETFTDHRFSTAAEFRLWMRQWFRRHRENFVMGKGTCIGLESLSAFQVHRIEGIAKHIVGDYYYSRVRHVLDVHKGYTCDFDARKTLDQKKPNSLIRAPGFHLPRSAHRAFPGSQ